MRAFSAVQALFAAALLLTGVVLLLSLGITGLIFLVPGFAFAAIAAVAQRGGRAGVLLALVADVGVALVAVNHLLKPPRPAPFPPPGALDLLVPAVALALVLAALVALLRDWRGLRAAAWFHSP